LIKEILKPQTVQPRFISQLPKFMTGLVVYGFLIFLVQLSLLDTGSLAMGIMIGLYNVMQVINPLIPAALLIGESVACSRLKEQGIFSLAPSLIVMAGQLRVFLFDKTGTLTKEGLQLLGVHEPERQSDGTMKFQGVVDMAEGQRYSLISEQHGRHRISLSDLGADTSPVLEASQIMQLALASCHTVTMVDGAPIGNPSEIEMFRRSGWVIKDQDKQRVLQNPTTGQQCVVLKTFEFDHNLMTQSVVLEYEGYYYAFCKGAYERLRDRLRERSAPDDYMQNCEVHAGRGCYVLSVGWRKLDARIEAVQSISRAQVENELDFLGLILFRNEPKEDTKAAISKLKEGDVHMAIVTGDNVLTGIHVARKVGICHPQKPFLLAKMDVSGTKVIWTDPDSVDGKAQDPPLVPMALGELKGEAAIREMLRDRPQELAITGAALAWMEKENPKLLQALLLRLRVFGRVQPMQKVSVVEWHKAREVTTGMCGDGGNDCGALKAAHIGVALSDAEASIVAPFSARDKSVTACEQLGRHGCAALSTSFALFRYLVTGGIVFTLMKTSLLIECLAFLPTMAYMYYDLVMNPFLCTFITRSQPAERLSKHRPTQSLLGGEFFCALLTLVVISIATMQSLWAVLLTAGPEVQFNGRNLKDPVTGKRADMNVWMFADSPQGTALFVWYSCVLVSVGLAVSHGQNFRKPLWSNWTLCIGGIVVLTVPFVCLWTGPNPLSCLFRANCDQQHVDSAKSIPFLSYLSLEAAHPGFNAEGGSNILPKSVMVGASCVGLAVIVLHQLAENAQLKWISRSPPAEDTDMDSLADDLSVCGDDK
jgi:cation-transporting ATPase 13A3/4/5